MFCPECVLTGSFSFSVLDWCFWNFHIGGIVLRRYIRKHLCHNCKKPLAGDTVLKEHFSDEYTSDDHFDIEIMVDEDPIVDDDYIYNPETPSMANKSTSETASLSRRKRKMFFGRDAETASRLLPEEYSQKFARNGSKLFKRAQKRIVMDKRPSYWDLMTTHDNGHRPYEETKEKLIRLYLGEKNLLIKKSEVMQVKKNYVIWIASIMDQCCSVIFPAAFIAYLIYFTMKWDIDWSRSGSYAPNDGGVPLLQFISPP